jgi:proteasome lid subunit RPN8/RPN11
MELQLRISGFHYDQLRQHLFPGDGKEAVAVALCGRFSDDSVEYVMMHQLTCIPHESCHSRDPDFIEWPTKLIHPYFEKLAKSNFCLLKIHSHPGGFTRFSETDNQSDLEFFDSAFGWSGTVKPHASAVMLPNGTIFGRFFFSDLHHEPIPKIVVVGSAVQHFTRPANLDLPAFAQRTIQAFGEKTYQMLSSLTIGVVGCSGTGSPVIEQLTRLGVGKLVIVDPDNIEEKNLNRILHATRKAAREGLSKVSVLKNAIEDIGIGTEVEVHPSNLYDDLLVLNQLVKCDVIFGCMDSVDGRYLLNQLCTFYLIPYFDLGVRLESDGSGGVTKICGSVYYIQPHMSSLLSRGVYNSDDVRASALFRKNPEEYAHLKSDGYIRNVNINNPAVISVNMQIASHAVNEFLNRIHPFKAASPDNYAGSTIDIIERYIVNVPESDYNVDEYLTKKVGKGDVHPFIEMSELNQ